MGGTFTLTWLGHKGRALPYLAPAGDVVEEFDRLSRLAEVCEGLDAMGTMASKAFR